MHNTLFIIVMNKESCAVIGYQNSQGGAILLSQQDKYFLCHATKYMDIGPCLFSV